jgi:acyl-CoA dehydrogenase
MAIEGLLRGGSTGVVVGLTSLGIALPSLVQDGRADLVDRFVRPALQGERIAALAITEPGTGSDVAGVRTRAVRDGDHFVVNGAKLFITSGVRADLVTTLVRTGDDPHGGLSFLVVERGTPGFTVSRALQKTGWRASDTAELFFENCRVPAGHLLGEEGRGFHSVMKNFQTERIALGAMAVAACRRSIELTLEHVRTRRAFGDTLWAKQSVRQKIAMLDAKTRAARQYLYHCAWRVTQGHDVVQDVSMLKALTGELVNEVLLGCQQFHGGMGYMRGTPIERLWRDARILAVGGGATEVMLDEAAKRY